MSTIKITDLIGANADLQIRDDSPLAKAKATQLVSAEKSLLGRFSQPVNEADFKSIALGIQMTTPSSLLDGVPSLMVGGGMNCDLFLVTAADKLLFPDDGFAPRIPVSENQCWVGFGMDASLGAKLSASADGFGAAVQAGTKLLFATYILCEADASPLPLLKDAVASALSGFSISCTAKQVREQAPGTVNLCDLSGTVSVSGSYEVPLSLGAFGSADLPFNMKLSVAPTATAEITGCITLAGDFIVRSHKLSSTVLHLGIYKKQGTTLVANLTTSAGVEVEAGSTDLLDAVLKAALPGVDTAKAGIPADKAKALNEVIEDSLDRSLSVSLNASCAAVATHEAAILYEIHLDQGDAGATDAALQSALRGDWTPMGKLANATSLRNIVVEMKTRKQKLSLNLLGFYNATSATSYISKCTILREAAGQLTIVDSENATRISATSTPYTADSDKLRHALAQDLITTATYAAIGSKLNLKMAIVQEYFDYANKMGSQQLKDDLLLGVALGVLPSGALDEVLSRGGPFAHARVNVTLHYDNDAALAIFFSDSLKRIPRSRPELEETGRKMMVALLDPTEAGNPARIRMLQDDAAWAAMDKDGDVGDFQNLQELRALNANELTAVGVDWTGIAWWAKTVCRVAPQLANTLAALDKVSPESADSDPRFMRERANLAAILGAVSRETKASFVGTWGPAVLSALSGRRGAVSMDVAWDGNSRHFEQVAVDAEQYVPV